MSSREELLGKAQALILSRLQERSEVHIPAIGLFHPLFHEEYILEEGEERLLVPPCISLSYQPAEYLLNAKHYTTLDQEAPSEYFAADFTSNLSDLHSLEESEVSELLTTYLKELLEGLFKGRRVTLLGLGDLFVTEEVAGVLLLNFIPNTELLQSLNTPFSVYKETKLREDIDFPDTEVRHSRPIEEHAYQYAVQQPEPEKEPEPITASEIITVSEPIVEPASPTVEEKKRDKSWVVWLGAAGAIIAGMIYYFSKPQQQLTVEPAETIEQASAPSDSNIVVVAEPAPVAPVAPLDTITVPMGGSLAAMARAYYDNTYYWVYLYIANADSIPDPNNLQPGQTLVIPPLEWYDLKSDPKEAEREAKAWATIILHGRFTSYKEQRPELITEP